MEFEEEVALQEEIWATRGGLHLKIDNLEQNIEGLRKIIDMLNNKLEKLEVKMDFTQASNNYEMNLNELEASHEDLIRNLNVLKNARKELISFEAANRAKAKQRRQGRKV